MSKLLKGKRVFLDTSEFVSSSFNLRTPAFVEFRRLCENRQLTLLTTDITRREIQIAMKWEADNAYKAFTGVSKAVHILNEPEKAEREALEKLEKKLDANTFFNALNVEIERFFLACHTINLPVPPTAIQNVLNLYFERQPPFGGKNKKAEFPDAFMVEALRTATKGFRETAYVISRDADFQKACEGNPKLVALESLSHLLDRVNVHEATVKQIEATLAANFNAIEKKLQGILKILRAEVRGREGVAQIDSIRLNDILDSLIVSCDGVIASVEFPCQVEVDALIEFAPETGDAPEIRREIRDEVVSITLVFTFNPKDPNTFHLERYWAPTALSF